MPDVCINGTQRGISPLAIASRRKKSRDKSTSRVAQLASRYERGLDLWTGKPLEGEDAREWLLTFYFEDEDELHAEHIAAIVAVVGEKVYVRNMRGEVELLKPKPNRKNRGSHQ